ncbi:hypothetical protein BS50DRAFT_608654 [Corynespora cassiicola Philippines]|uniref:BTB domain-containing protein n=1 Tax=Corynespora cassiicola Philippines TaxID=1448308 RepID=A0A2T2NXG2_CORCC|nr:hypothetical protein BS50DRAFT_608654 [Corynespora cassiicola Philippines]
MAPSFEEILKSGQFTFRIGEEKYPIIVHAAAIAATSYHMRALINGGMRESEERTADIIDLTVEDFIRFCEFAYRGDYTVPQWEQDPEPTEISSQIPASHAVHEYIPHFAYRSSIPPETLSEDESENEWDAGEASGEVPVEASAEAPTEPADYPQSDYPISVLGKKTKKKKKTSYKLALEFKNKFRKQIDERNYIRSSDVKDEILKQAVPYSNENSRQNFTPVFLAHARLYTFATMRLVEPLKYRALDKLHSTLKGFRLYTNRINDVVELARYAYGNGEDRRDDGTIDDLRKLVVEYIADNVHVIGNNAHFFALMEEGSEFVGDFWSIVRKFMI